MTTDPTTAPADSHDLIRVQGARENNLKDISVELPKRRLTVFTGVSGSGKSSLVFSTIAAESQRMINETYSSFVQGFMPSLARPDVDVLDGLTTAIIVDQERMGANSRSTVGTVTDANAMLRILFSRLGMPHIGSPQAFSFNVPSVTGGGAIKIEGKETIRRSFSQTGGMCPRCEGMGSVSDIDLTQIVDETKSLAGGAITVPGYTADGWSVRMFTESGFFDADKPIRDYSETERHDLLYKEPVKVKINGINITYEGLVPKVQKSMLSKDVERDAAAHPRVRRAGGRLHRVPGVRRHAPQRGRAHVEDQGHQHRRRLRDADQRPRRVGARTGRALRRARCWRTCATPSTPSSTSVSATSRSTGRPARCPAARRSAPR